MNELPPQAIENVPSNLLQTPLDACLGLAQEVKAPLVMLLTMPPPDVLPRTAPANELIREASSRP